MHALYLDRSRDARPLPRRLTGHVAHPFAPFNLILVLFSFVFVGRDLVASRRPQHIVFGRRRLKLIVRRDEQIAKLVGLANREIGVRVGFPRFFGQLVGDQFLWLILFWFSWDSNWFGLR
jgi:hypothetical protein